MRRVATLLIAATALAAQPGGAAELTRETAQAFERYIRATEARLEQQLKGGAWLWTDGSPERKKLVQQGRVVSEPFAGDGDIEAGDGLIHDWIGAVFVPGVTLDRMLLLVQDYDNHKNIYKPEVMDSRLLAREGDHLTVYLRLLKKKVVTVVLNTRHDARFFRISPNFAHSRSYSTHIGEMDDAGKPSEKELPQGQDHGFLWRLHSYWRFLERDGGVYVECEAISLTRGVPSGLGWLINPIVRTLPRESLANTLRATRDAAATARR